MGRGAKKRARTAKRVAASAYVILGVPKHLHDDDNFIKRQFKEMALRLHPDKNQGKSIEDFKKVRNAYERIKDSAARLQGQGDF